MFSHVGYGRRGKPRYKGQAQTGVFPHVEGIAVARNEHVAWAGHVDAPRSQGYEILDQTHFGWTLSQLGFA